VPLKGFCDRGQADVFPQISGQFGRRTGPVEPGGKRSGKNGYETALVHSIGDGEFKAQHDAALGEHI